MARASLCIPMTVCQAPSFRLGTDGQVGSRNNSGWRISSNSDSIKGRLIGSSSQTDRRVLGVCGIRRGSIKARGRCNRILVRAAADKKESNIGDDGVETLFMRELRRRGMSSKEKDGAPVGSGSTETKTKEESEGGGSFFGGWSLPGGASTKPKPPMTESQREEQLKRSMALNSEGIDGLIPRGTELLKLGSTFFVIFWPFIVASLAAFGAVYLYFGSAFIHTGNSFDAGARPPYVDPYQLLEEEVLPPGVGPNRVPFNSRQQDGSL